MIDCKIQTGVDVSHIRLVVKVPTDPRFTLIEINVNEDWLREAREAVTAALQILSFPADVNWIDERYPLIKIQETEKEI